MTNNEIDSPADPMISPEALALLGRRQDRLREDDPLRGRAEAVSAGAGSSRRASLLYALHAADGTPIMLTDSREAAIANAWSQELETVSVH